MPRSCMSFYFRAYMTNWGLGLPTTRLMAGAIAIKFVENVGVLGTTGERPQDFYPCIYIA